MVLNVRLKTLQFKSMLIKSALSLLTAFKVCSVLDPTKFEVKIDGTVFSKIGIGDSCCFYKSSVPQCAASEFKNYSSDELSLASVAC